MRRLIAIVLLLAFAGALWGVTVALQITNGADDTRRTATTGFNATAGDIYVGEGPGVSPGHGSWRWVPSTPIPDGATITSCVFNAMVGDTPSAMVYADLYFVKAINPAAPTTYSEFDALPLTTAKVDVDISSAVTAYTRYDTPSCVAPLQEVIDGTTGDLAALEIVLKNDPTTATDVFLTVTTYEASVDWGARLTVEYTTGGGSTAVRKRVVVTQ